MRVVAVVTAFDPGPQLATLVDEVAPQVAAVVVVEFVVVTGPSETSRPTIEPLAAFVPWTGTCEMTSPTVFADGMREMRVVKPAAVSFAVACAWVRPTTRGTATVPEPLETVSRTVEPFGARLSAAGD